MNKLVELAYLPLGITGRTMCDACWASANTVFSATCHRLLSFSGSPVFGFTSKRGKLLLEISNRILWPRPKTSDVGYISTVNSYGRPGWRNSGLESWFRYRARTMLSATFRSIPEG